MIILPHKFDARDYQNELYRQFFIEKKKKICCVWHRRAGKDKTFVNLTAGSMLERIGNYVYLFPTHRQARLVIWNGIDGNGLRFIDHFNPNLIEKVNSTEMMITYKNGSTFQLLGSDHYDSLMGSNFVGFVFSEFSLQNPKAWELLKPIVAENKAWTIFQGTPRGENHFFDIYNTSLSEPGWYSSYLNVDDTTVNNMTFDKNNLDRVPVISKETIEQFRREGMSDEMIEQEFYCSFTAANVGAYYGKQIKDALDDGRISNEFKIEPLVPVYTGWDIGYHDYMAIWFMQPINGKLRIIHYYEVNNVGLNHCIEYLREFQMRKGFRSYGWNFLPHDIEVHEQTEGKTRLEYLKRSGLKIKVVKKMPVSDGIDICRRIIPICEFNLDGCKDGIQVLRNYHKEFDNKNHIYKDSPRHDDSSHGADGFRYLCCGWNAHYENPLPLKPIALDTYHPF